jgi:hypothetical protein
MPEQTREIRTRIVEYWCDRCDQSTMKPTDVTVAKLSYPPRYEHQCLSCCATIHLPKLYPFIECEYLEDANG